MGVDMNDLFMAIYRDLLRGQGRYFMRNNRIWWRCYGYDDRTEYYSELNNLLGWKR